MKQYSLNKQERLCSKKQISELFENGNSFTESPFKIVWKESNKFDSCNRAKIAISIPKRNIKKAINRNLLKRRTKEAYRLHKKTLYNYLNNCDKHIILILIFINKEEVIYKEIEDKIIVILQRLIQEHKKRSSNV